MEELVNVDVRKMAGRNANRNWRWGNVSVLFGSLTRNTLLSLVFQQKPRCDEATGGSDVRMTEGMEMLENLIVEGSRDERAKVLVEVSPSKESSGVRGMEVMKREGLDLS